MKSGDGFTPHCNSQTKSMTKFNEKVKTIKRICDLLSLILPTKLQNKYAEMTAKPDN